MVKVKELKHKTDAPFSVRQFYYNVFRNDKGAKNNA